MAYRSWRELAGRSTREIVSELVDHDCDLRECYPASIGYRDHLEQVMHALPARSSRELHLLVSELDARIVEAAQGFRSDTDWRWWRAPL